MVNLPAKPRLRVLPERHRRRRNVGAGALEEATSLRVEDGLPVYDVTHATYDLSMNVICNPLSGW